MNEIIAATLATRRLSMILLNAFAVLALSLASIGIYGVISYVVGQRTQEIGIRMAMGADRVDVVRMVAGQGLKLIVIGFAVRQRRSLGRDAGAQHDAVWRQAVRCGDVCCYRVSVALRWHAGDLCAGRARGQGRSHHGVEGAMTQWVSSYCRSVEHALRGC